MPKVYLRATGVNGFQWLKNPSKATADYKKATEATLKQLRTSKLIEVPQPRLMRSKWLISRGK
jgi:hypothetical protein